MLKQKATHVAVAPMQSISTSSLELTGEDFLHFNICSEVYQYFLTATDPFLHFFSNYMKINSAKTEADCSCNNFTLTHVNNLKITGFHNSPNLVK